MKTTPFETKIRDIEDIGYLTIGPVGNTNNLGGRYYPNPDETLVGFTMRVIKTRNEFRNHIDPNNIVNVTVRPFNAATGKYYLVSVKGGGFYTNWRDREMPIAECVIRFFREAPHERDHTLVQQGESNIVMPFGETGTIELYQRKD